jgi:hypothetical protein
VQGNFEQSEQVDPMVSIPDKLSYEPNEIERREGVILRTATYVTTYEYLKDIIRTDSWSLLDTREQTLIIGYLTDDKPLDNFKSIAGVSSRERVRQIIVGGIRRTYKFAPLELKLKYSGEEILKLKKSTVLTGRPALLESRRQRGRTMWDTRGEELTQAVRDGISRRKERIERGEIQPHTRHSSSSEK